MPIGFCVEMNAPDGLAGLELTGCSLDLRPHTSSHNDKVVLRSPVFNQALDWNMAASDDEVMFAEGSLESTLVDAVAHLQSLSRCLVSADVPHLIIIDDESENPMMRIEYKWLEA